MKYLLFNRPEWRNNGHQPNLGSSDNKIHAFNSCMNHYVAVCCSLLNKFYVTDGNGTLFYLVSFTKGFNGSNMPFN